MASKQQKQTKISKAAKGPTGAKEATVPQAPEVSVRDQIIDAALNLAGVQAWEHCSIRDIAQEAGVSLAEFYDHFDDRTDILVAFGHRVDRKILAAYSAPDYEADPRDRLFDILMERFDAANEHRDALVSIIQSHKADPKQLVTALPHLCGSMSKMLEAAGLDTGGFRGAARVMGLSAAFVWVMRTWATDDSEDLGKTMAALDKWLGNLEKAANTLNL